MSAQHGRLLQRRSRLPAGALRALARRTAGRLRAAAAAGWKWRGRGVFVAAGPHVSMPDTPANRAAYPQVYSQEPGPGSPLARLAVLLSLATGAGHDLGAAPYAGRGTGAGHPAAADVRVAAARGRGPGRRRVRQLLPGVRTARGGVDPVARRKYDRAGSRVVRRGPGWAVLAWRRPQKPRGMAGQQYRTYPKTLLMRQVSVDSRDPDNRVERWRLAFLAPLRQSQ